ncbi:MAG: benzoyl-CoA 2,3-epoxidase subunit BoxA [Ascidiaceihabitans sp.]|nr:benzoyl-CoA 2,3-epoxidase subunit BoxA [Ascidiaceihabitans sp.]
MNQPFKQHLIDPEICIRCYTCEMSCPIEAIVHNDDNVVVNADICNMCMDCISVCPTGSIDEWRVVNTAYTVEEQFGWEELPDQQDIVAATDGDNDQDDVITQLFAQAHAGAGGKAKAPATAAKPTINMYNLGKPATASVHGNYRLTDGDSDSDVRHIILDLGSLPFPVLEGQSVGIIPPGVDGDGNPHLPRLYSVSSPRDGERAGFNNLSLTVKRDEGGVCSNFICDLNKGDSVQLTGPFGATFLLPSDPAAHILMICTGTGSAPFRGMTMHRQREMPSVNDALSLVFGARSPRDLPYFGPLKKVPDAFLKKAFAFSRQEDTLKQYVQDKLREDADSVAALLEDPNGYIYVCGLKAMEVGVEEALSDIARSAGLEWTEVRDTMREDGRYHLETY